MSIRLTGFSTPVLGASWEYVGNGGKKTGDTLPSAPFMLPNRKLKVFISSKCDEHKYNPVRKALKEAIEETNLADVYLFEAEGAATKSAGDHYCHALEDSDLCIFLIDNADGVSPGVQREIDTVNKHNKRALYYFCDEITSEKTALENSMMGAQFAKSKTVHSFSELIVEGARGFIEDVISVYHDYCARRLISHSEVHLEDVQELELAEMLDQKFFTMPKTTIKNIDRCRNYIVRIVMDNANALTDEDIKATSELDQWCYKFLSVVLDGHSIEDFNISMMLAAIAKIIPSELYQVVQLRWDAIQAYYCGDVSATIKQLETALEKAHELNQPEWIIKDILIDLRNQNQLLDTLNNQHRESIAQQQLSNSTKELYYPVIDRIQASLQEKYVSGLFDEKIKSPYSVSISNELYDMCAMVASQYIIAVCNGSLTHILMLVDKLKDMFFYLSSKYSDWAFKLGLLKVAIYLRNPKEIKGIVNSYPELLRQLNADEAVSVMRFCNSNPIKHHRLISQLYAFGKVGYYLNDQSFAKYEEQLFASIHEWLCADRHPMGVGKAIFDCLADVSLRVSQDKIATLCSSILEHKLRFLYHDMFQFFFHNIHLKKMNTSIASHLISQVAGALADESVQETIKLTPSFLFDWRNQDRTATETLDKMVEEYLPSYYSGEYHLETARDDTAYRLGYLQQCIKHIQHANATQGVNGTYYVYGTRYISTAINLLVSNTCEPTEHTLDELVEATFETLTIAKESASTKLDAVWLLTIIRKLHPEVYSRKQDLYSQIADAREAIEVDEHMLFSSNMDGTVLRLGILLLMDSIGNNVYADIMTLMPFFQEDSASAIELAEGICRCMEAANGKLFSAKVESIILHTLLQWLRCSNTRLRWLAARMLLQFLHAEDHKMLINRQLEVLVETDNVYIKNMIIRSMGDIEGIPESTRNNILTRGMQDANYAVRMVCAEVSAAIKET